MIMFTMYKVVGDFSVPRGFVEALNNGKIVDNVLIARGSLRSHCHCKEPLSLDPSAEPFSGNQHLRS